jgi:mediator of RNA polymerase II transcription subunit 31
MAEPEKEGAGEERAKNRKRFELELEFVQALANPFYLHSLAQQGILYQPAFINYLKYLLYWKEKDYARFILCVIPSWQSTSLICTPSVTHMLCIT